MRVYASFWLVQPAVRNDMKNGGAYVVRAVLRYITLQVAVALEFRVLVVVYIYIKICLYIK